MANVEKVDAALLERLGELEAKASKGPWAYRPDKHDDWGTVKGPSHRPEGWEYDTRWPLARFRLDTTKAEEAEARTERADPWRADAEYVVFLRNHASDIIATQSTALEKLQAKLDAKEAERADLWRKNRELLADHSLEKAVSAAMQANLDAAYGRVEALVYLLPQCHSAAKIAFENATTPEDLQATAALLTAIDTLLKGTTP